jgi:hypothetical protein
MLLSFWQQKIKTATHCSDFENTIKNNTGLNIMEER